MDEKRYEQDIDRGLQIGKKEKVLIPCDKVSIDGGQRIDREQDVIQDGGMKRIYPIPLLKEKKGPSQ
jgi:hypothetical protein